MYDLKILTRLFIWSANFMKFRFCHTSKKISIAEILPLTIPLNWVRWVSKVWWCCAKFLGIWVDMYRRIYQLIVQCWYFRNHSNIYSLMLKSIFRTLCLITMTTWILRYAVPKLLLNAYKNGSVSWSQNYILNR